MHNPRRFAICDTEFTELRTTFESAIGKPTYRHFQLDVRIDAKEKYAHITQIRPVSTSKYNPESKVSSGSKKAWSILGSATLSFPKPQGTIGASGSQTGEKSTAIEKTSLVSRIIQRDIGPTISWSFHIADPFDQDTGLTLSSEKLPRAHFEFRAKNPAPPPKYLTLEISTYWSLLSAHATSSAWLSSEDTPSFSNLCQVVTLDLPSDLQGFHKYNADLLVWPKHSKLGATVTKPGGELEEGVGGLVTTKVVDTDHHIDSST